MNTRVYFSIAALTLIIAACVDTESIGTMDQASTRVASTDYDTRAACDSARGAAAPNECSRVCESYCKSLPPNGKKVKKAKAGRKCFKRNPGPKYWYNCECDCGDDLPPPPPAEEPKGDDAAALDQADAEGWSCEAGNPEACAADLDEWCASGYDERDEEPEYPPDLDPECAD